MKIRTLRLKPFGALKDEKREFVDGFNHISLDNEGGKSTIVEAIKVGFFNYSQKKNYAYLPNLEDIASMSMDLSFDGLPSPVTLERSNLKKSLSSYLKKGTDMIEVDKLTLAKIAQSYLGPDCEAVSIEVQDEDFILDGEKISQQEKYIKASEKSDISYIEAMDYRGRSIEELIALRDNRMKEIYTKNSNSKSELAALKAEQEEIRESRIELSEINQEAGEAYNSYQEKSLRLEELNKMIGEGEVRLRELEIEIRNCELLEEYRALKKIEKEKNFRAIKAMTPLKEYEKLLNDKAYQDRRIAELQSRLDNIRFTEEEKTLIELRKLELEEGVKLTEAFTELIRAEELLSEKEVLENSLANLGFLGGGLDIDEARAERSSYQGVLSEMESLNEEEKNPYFYLIAIMALGSVLMAYFFKGEKFLALLSLALLFLGFILSGFFYLAKRRDNKHKTLRKRELERKIIENYTELKKIDSIRVLMSENRSMDSSYQSVEKVFECFRNLEAVKKEEEAARAAFFELIRALPLTSFLLNLTGEERLNYAEFYLQRAGELWRRKEEGLELELEKRREEEIRKGLLSNKEEVEAYYLNEFQTKDGDEIQKLIEESRIHDNKKKELLEEAKSLNLALEDDSSPHSSSEVKRKESQELEDLLKENKGEKQRLNDEIIELKSSLKMGPKLRNIKYSGYHDEELEALELAINERMNSLHKEYDRLSLEMAVLKEMDIILKERMKPKFIQQASEYFKIIAPDSDIRMDMGEKGTIIFIDEQSQTVFPFTNLSTATRAQLIFCIKLAKLDEKDENKAYPLIIDDAFMAYDQKRYEGALELLKHIAEQRQVICLERV